MKAAILSDIHGNIHALEAVWEDLLKQEPDVVYCLGDLVGYGAFPYEVIGFIREHGIATVLGNYDEAVAFDLSDCGCFHKDPALAISNNQSLLWSRERTTDEHKSFLRSLPIQIRASKGRPSYLLVHGSPRRMNEYLYAHLPPATFKRMAKLVGCDIVLFGHTHLSYQKQIANTWFINAGSVGVPMDGDPRAGYVLINLKRPSKAVFRRVPYDVHAAIHAIRCYDLPQFLADMLERGGSERIVEPAFVA